MIPKVQAVRHVRGFSVHLRFTDGVEGNLDLEAELHGPVFEALRGPALFSQVRVHPEFRTLCWPNGADLAPEFLYERVRAMAAAARG
jgi:hypothetical protein